MQSIVSQITVDPESLIKAENASLREGLYKSSPRELRLFAGAMAAYLKDLENPRFEAYKVKLTEVFPPPSQAAVEEGDEISDFFTVLCGEKSAPPSKGSLLRMWNENRPLCFALTGVETPRRSEDLPLSVLRVFLTKPDSPHDFLLEEEISLSHAISGRILFERGAEPEISANVFKKILQVYAKRFKGDEFKWLLESRGKKIAFELLAVGAVEKFMHLLRAADQAEADLFSVQMEDSLFRLKFPWVNSSEDWDLLFKKLSVAAKTTLEKRYPGYFILIHGLSSDQKPHAWLEGISIIIRAVSIHAEPVSPTRNRRTRTYLENYFMMLNLRKPTMAVAQALDAKPIASKRDRVYREFSAKQTRRELVSRRRELMSDLSTTKSETSLWDDEAFMIKAHTYMKLAFLESVYFFREASEKTGGDPDLMKAYLETHFAENFRIGGFIEFYNFFRHGIIPEGTPLTPIQAQTARGADPFYTPSSYPFHWRLMQTALCLLPTHYKLKPLSPPFNLTWDL